MILSESHPQTPFRSLRADHLGFIRILPASLPSSLPPLLPEEVARRERAVPLRVEGEYLHVAFDHPPSAEARMRIQVAARRPIRPFLAPYPEVRQALNHLYGTPSPLPPYLPLGTLLLRLGHLSAHQLQNALDLQEREGGRLGEICQRQGWIRERDWLEALAWQNNLPHMDLEEIPVQPALALLLPWEEAQRTQILPLAWGNGGLWVALAVPEARRHLSALAEELGFPLWPILTTPRAWRQRLRALYLRGQGEAEGRRTRFLDLLLRQTGLGTPQAQAVHSLSRQTGAPVEQILLQEGLLDPEGWLRFQAEHFDLPVGRFQPPRAHEVVHLFPANLAWTLDCIPLGWTETGDLEVGTDRYRPGLEACLAAVTGLSVQVVLLRTDELERAREALYGPLPPRLPATVPLGFGSLLRQLGWVSPAQLQEVAGNGTLASLRIGERLMIRGYLSEFDLIRILSLQTGLPYAHLDHAWFEPEILNLLPADWFRKHLLVPLWANGTGVWVALADPLNGQALAELEAAVGLPVWPLLAPPSTLTAILEQGLPRRRPHPQADRREALVQSLVREGLLDQKKALEVLQRLRSTGEDLDRILIDLGVPDAFFAEPLARLLGLPYVDLSLRETWIEAIDPLGERVQRRILQDPVDRDVARLLSAELARQWGILPFGWDGDRIRVAVTGPEGLDRLPELEGILGAPAVPSLTSRTLLEEAIQRVLEQPPLGTALLLAGRITRAQLNDALELASHTGIRLGQALLHRGYIDEGELYAFLAAQARLPLKRLGQEDLNEEAAWLLDPETERELGILPLRREGRRLVLGTVDPLNQRALEVARERTGLEIEPVLIPEGDLEWALEQLYRDEYRHRSTYALLQRAPEDSAYWVLSRGQKVVAGILVLTAAVWGVLHLWSLLLVVNTLITLFYVVTSAHKFYLVYKALDQTLEIPVSREEVEALEDRELPYYTLLIPLYREAEVLPRLLKAIENLDYPTPKLDVKVLLEADDLDTQAAFDALSPPPHVQKIIVPPGEPQTKPKACNYGLIHARGEYVVIYDAEDLPEPDQLKKAIVAFRKADPQVVCLQAKLNYYNSHQNLLTRWFTVEYSMWFDLFLPGLYASRAPIPLGGTSNHFRRQALLEVGAWDPHNVTEDADLGMRLFKRGYTTAIVDSTTYEEANSEVYNWIRQRSRWLKGYMQTWLVHMRHPIKLWREIGPKAFLSFQLVVGGTALLPILNPVYWALTTFWFAARWEVVRFLFPSLIFYIAALNLYVGNFAFTFMNVAGALNRRYYDMVKFALLSPLYWGLISLGAWKGLLQLLYKPSYWEKTVHGLFEGDVDLGPADEVPPERRKDLA